MSRNNKLFLVVAVLFLGFMYWVMAEVFGGWDIIAFMMASFAVGMVVMGACMVAVLAIIYYLTLYRSNRYAKLLQDAGYAVYLHTHQVWEFAIMVLIACTFTPISIWLTIRFYEIHSCMSAGSCSSDAEWYMIAIFIGVMVWSIALLGVCGAISMWWQSFRPLRHYYNDMQLGHTLDLPRLR